MKFTQIFITRLVLALVRLQKPIHLLRKAKEYNQSGNSIAKNADLLAPHFLSFMKCIILEEGINVCMYLYVYMHTYIRVYITYIGLEDTQLLLSLKGLMAQKLEDHSGGIHVHEFIMHQSVHVLKYAYIHLRALFQSCTLDNNVLDLGERQVRAVWHRADLRMGTS